MQFEFATADRILFGPGVLSQVGPAAARLGRRALLARGCDSDRSGPLVEQLTSAGVEVEVFCVSGEPTTDSVRQAVEQARRAGCDLVIGFGGGSVLDTGKATAAMLTNPGDVLDYLEVIGRGKAISVRPAPCIAVPTTAGTGSEVTRNAVLGSPEHGVKVSMRSPLMLPVLALVDPELTYSLPPEVTASTGLDALTQLIEPYVSIKANPLTDALCREGLRRAARSLLRAYRQGDDPAARLDMSLASLFGGLALANAALGAVHGFAGVIGGQFPGPHGAVCARLLPFVFETNLRALSERLPEGGPHDALTRLAEVARLITGNEASTPADGLAWLHRMVEELQIPPLSAYGLRRENFLEVVEKTVKSSSMKGNPIPLTADELHGILERAL